MISVADVSALVASSSRSRRCNHHPHSHKTPVPRHAHKLSTVCSCVVEHPCAEAVLKLLGLGARSYFGVTWNRFDFVLVAAAYVGYFTALPSFTTVLRVFRVLRVVRLVRGSKAMFQILNTLFMSLPSFANVAAILMLVYFIFAVGACCSCMFLCACVCTYIVLACVCVCL
jgi:hypothetical protein